MMVTVGLAQSDQAGLDAKDQVVERLWAGNQVVGSGQSSTLVEVGEPQFSSSKLPLHVCVFLWKHTHKHTHSDLNFKTQNSQKGCSVFSVST